jgi:hypothetical protein
MTHFVAGDMVESAAAYERAVALHQATGERRALASALSLLCCCDGSTHVACTAFGRTAIAAEVIADDRPVRLTREIGWRAGQAFVLYVLGNCHGWRGEYDRALPMVRESLAIAEEVGRALERARGAEERAASFRSFDTICSATQDRQDAVNELLEEPLDVMLVVGGYNSSNTMSLAAICAEKVPTYHVEDAEAIDPGAGVVRYRPIGTRSEEATKAGWLPATGPVRVGITAGASTPNNKIGLAVARIFATRGIGEEELGLGRE